MLEEPDAAGGAAGTGRGAAGAKGPVPSTRATDAPRPDGAQPKRASGRAPRGPLDPPAPPSAFDTRRAQSDSRAAVSPIDRYGPSTSTPFSCSMRDGASWRWTG